MTPDLHKITVHMVSSLDGFIASKDNSVAWFETPDNYDKGVAGQDPEEFLKTIDCYVMGSHTYEHALELSKSHGWPYGDVPTIVITSRKLEAERKNIDFYNGDLYILGHRLLKPHFKNVWIVGGAMLARDFIRLQLVDEIRLSILPIILGDGTPFFDHIGKEFPLHLKDVTAYKNGMVELWYEVKKGDGGIFKGIDAKLNEIAAQLKTQVTTDVGGYTVNDIEVPRKKIQLRKIIWIDGDIGKGIMIEPNFEDGNFDSPTWKFTNLAWLQHGQTKKSSGRPMWMRVLLKKEKFETIEKNIDQLLNSSIENLLAIKRSDLK